MSLRWIQDKTNLFEALRAEAPWVLHDILFKIIGGHIEEGDWEWNGYESIYEIKETPFWEWITERAQCTEEGRRLTELEELNLDRLGYYCFKGGCRIPWKMMHRNQKQAVIRMKRDGVDMSCHGANCAEVER